MVPIFLASCSAPKPLAPHSSPLITMYKTCSHPNIQLHHSVLQLHQTTFSSSNLPNFSSGNSRACNPLYLKHHPLHYHSAHQFRHHLLGLNSNSTMDYILFLPLPFSPSSTTQAFFVYLASLLTLASSPLLNPGDGKCGRLS